MSSFYKTVIHKDCKELNKHYRDPIDKAILDKIITPENEKYILGNVMNKINNTIKKNNGAECAKMSTHGITYLIKNLAEEFELRKMLSKFNKTGNITANNITQKKEKAASTKTEKAASTKIEKAASTKTKKNNNSLIENKTVANQISYRYKNTIDDNFKDILLNMYPNSNNKIKLSLPRILSQAMIQLKDNQEVKSLIEKLKTKIPTNEFKFDYNNFAYLPILKNLDDISIEISKQDGTFINNKNIPLDKKGKFGKPNPETKKYYLKKGSGSILLQKIITKLKQYGIKTLFLHAANPQLVTFYEKQGFKILYKSIPMLEMDDYIVYYGEGGSGPLMYMNL